MNKLQHIKIILGYSLIELLAVIAIVVILASAGYPSYIKFKQTTNRADATTTLINMQNTIQRYLIATNSQALSSSALASLYTLPIPSKNGYYNINISNLLYPTARATTAWYGDPGNVSRRFDVTSTINSIIAGGATSVQASNAIFGDPASGTVKTLSITFTSGTTLTCSESSTLTFPSGILYTITATATGKQAQDTNCNTISIDSAGNKSATNSSNQPSGCW